MLFLAGSSAPILSRQWAIFIWRFSGFLPVLFHRHLSCEYECKPQLRFCQSLQYLPVSDTRLDNAPCERRAKGKKRPASSYLPAAPAVACTGKILGCLYHFLTGTAITLAFGIIISFFAHPDWPVIAGNFIGLALLGAALISIALFISAHTENQIIAAVGGFAAGLFFLLSDAMVSVISEPLLKRIFSALSLQQHYNSFTLGLLNTVDIVFFSA